MVESSFVGLSFEVLKGEQTSFAPAILRRSWGVPFWMNTTSAPVSALRVEFVASFVQQATDDAGGEVETAV